MIVSLSMYNTELQKVNNNLLHSQLVTFDVIADAVFTKTFLLTITSKVVVITFWNKNALIAFNCVENTQSFDHLPHTCTYDLLTF